MNAQCSCLLFLLFTRQKIRQSGVRADVSLDFTSKDFLAEYFRDRERKLPTEFVYTIQSLSVVLSFGFPHKSFFCGLFELDYWLWRGLPSELCVVMWRHGIRVVLVVVVVIYLSYLRLVYIHILVTYIHYSTLPNVCVKGATQVPLACYLCQQQTLLWFKSIYS